MKNRSRMQSMAQVHIADLRAELKEGNRSILSRRLQELMEERLEKKEQIMLFLNRRGYSGFVSCRECGQVVKCPHCNVSLSVHRGGKMVCHYCVYEQPKVTRCPECGSPYIGEFRAGTQQIEDLVKKRFPEAKNTPDGYGHHPAEGRPTRRFWRLLPTRRRISCGDPDDRKEATTFPNVTLVGVLAADMSLYTDDYRSGERTFQLLTQAAGRAGRGERPGMW